MWTFPPTCVSSTRISNTMGPGDSTLPPMVELCAWNPIAPVSTRTFPVMVAPRVRQNAPSGTMTLPSMTPVRNSVRHSKFFADAAGTMTPITPMTAARTATRLSIGHSFHVIANVRCFFAWRRHYAVEESPPFFGSLLPTHEASRHDVRFSKARGRVCNRGASKRVGCADPLLIMVNHRFGVVGSALGRPASGLVHDHRAAHDGAHRRSASIFF